MMDLTGRNRWIVLRTMMAFSRSSCAGDRQGADMKGRRLEARKASSVNKMRQWAAIYVSRMALSES